MKSEMTLLESLVRTQPGASMGSTARKIGVSRSTLHKWTNGTYYPAPVNEQRLEALFNIAAPELLARSSAFAVLPLTLQ